MSECWNEETEGAVTLFEKELQAAEMSRDLQANFDEGEWKKYCECTDFKWTRVTRHEGDWWFGIGGGDVSPHEGTRVCPRLGANSGHAM